MKFINGFYDRSFFDDFYLENCIFTNATLLEVEYEKCIFKNCLFIDSDLSDSTFTETILNEWTFLVTSLEIVFFESCHFIKPTFNYLKGGGVGSAVLVNSKISNSKKSIEFEEVYLGTVVDQIKDLED